MTYLSLTDMETGLSRGHIHLCPLQCTWLTTGPKIWAPVQTMKTALIQNQPLEASCFSSPRMPGAEVREELFASSPSQSSKLCSGRRNKKNSLPQKGGGLAREALLLLSYTAVLRGSKPPSLTEVPPSPTTIHRRGSRWACM